MNEINVLEIGPIGFRFFVRKKIKILVKKLYLLRIQRFL